MKSSKNKKIILLISGLGILTISILVPILVLNNKQENKEVQIEKEISAIEIKSKIKYKDLIIPKNIKTFSDEEILSAIKAQLKINNSSLTNKDLSKITDNIWHLKPGKKTFVTLKINSLGLKDSIEVNVTKEKNIKFWTKNSAIVKNSNIKVGKYSRFIQDSSGNFWSIGNSSKLQVLKRDGVQWQEDVTTGLTKGSNIIGHKNDGKNAVIFEDDFGNIWSMGKDKKLQILVKNKDGTFANSWTDNNEENGEKLLQGSKINDGYEGSIFQDSFGNLWSMAAGSKLQVLVKNKDGNYATSWDSNNSNSSQGLLKNSNIFNGRDGTIFQDSFGNLWSMGYVKYYRPSSTNALDYSLLQVLKADSNSPTGYVKTGWTYHWGEELLLKNSYIIRGQEGIIFQDSFGNLWASGGITKLQVLEANENGDGYIKTGWINDNTKGLLKNSKIFPTKKSTFQIETIFQDSFGNLWMHGWAHKPQVLEANENGDGYIKTGWTNDNTKGLLNNLKLFNYSYWVFFQDSSKNLWAMGNGTKLQVLKAKTDGSGYVNTWINDNSKNGDELLRFSYINDGSSGVIFEDSSKNLWAVGGRYKEISKLQVYDKSLKKWIH